MFLIEMSRNVVVLFQMIVLKFHGFIVFTFLKLLQQNNEKEKNESNNNNFGFDFNIK